MAATPVPVPQGSSGASGRVQALHRFAGRLTAALDELTGVGIGCLSGREATETASELLAAAERITGLALGVLPAVELAESSDLVDPEALAAQGPVAATDTTAWLAHANNLHGRTAHRLVALGRELDTDCVATGQALRAGTCDVAQAQVITRAVTALPRHVGQDVRARAEAHLLAEATRLDAVRLGRVAKRLLEVVDPEAAEAILAARLRAEEDAARSRSWLRMRADGHGSVEGDFRVPELHAAMLRACLEALTNPARPEPIARTTTDPVPDLHLEVDPGAGTHQAGEPQVRRRASGAVWGEALCQLLERLDVEQLPRHGGTPATVIVTMDLPTLLGAPGAATVLDAEGGTPLSAGAARRLACRAGVVPAVLGTDSHVLDLGRRTRLFTPAQRLALATRQHGTCAATGCSRPWTWADAHHLDWWSRGGTTDLDNAALLCPRHHTLIHHDHYTWSREPDGQITLTRRRPGPGRT